MNEIQIRDDEYIEEAIVSIVLATFLKELQQLIVHAVQVYLFSKEDKKLSKKITELLSEQKIYRGKWKVYVLSVPGQDAVNAFSFGIGKKHVFITKRLLSMLNERETIAILLHEAAHSTQLHMVQRLATKYIFMQIMVSLLKKFGRSLTKPMILQYILFMFVPQLITSRTVSRWQEYISDSYAAKMGYGKDLISGMNKLNKYLKTACTTQFCKLAMKVNGVLAEHPSLENRVKNVLEVMSRKTGKIKYTDVVRIVKREFKHTKIKIKD